MFQQLKKLSQSSNTTVSDRATKLMARYAFSPVAIDNNHYIVPIPPVSLLDLSDRTLESQADRVYGYALDFLRLRPEQFEIQFEGTAFALLID
jgi:hypothetical protein